MQISAINSYNTSFKSNPKKQEYENPIDRGTEKSLAVLSSIGTSAVAGAIAGGLTTCVTEGKKIPIAVGAGAALAVLGLTLPSKLYNTSVNAYTREKEMDVFSRQKAAQNNIYEGINDELQNNDIPLSEKINHYATVKMADNGNGMMIKGV